MYMRTILAIVKWANTGITTIGRKNERIKINSITEREKSVLPTMSF